MAPDRRGPRRGAAIIVEPAAFWNSGGKVMSRSTAKPTLRHVLDTSLGEFVLGELKDAIRRGRYQPGQRVREAEVAAWLGVSRTPVREAFRRLQSDGLIRLAPWRGAVVAELDRGQVVELYAMRRALEGTAAALAALHATDAEIAVFFELLRRDDAPGIGVKQRIRINRLFHQALYRAAHNRYLLQALNALSDSLALLKSTTYEVPGRPDAARLEHMRIAEAIRNRDPAAAEQATRSHIETAELARLELLFGPG
jgi:DNA-binding GntR family transcriptional regulator